MYNTCIIYIYIDNQTKSSYLSLYDPYLILPYCLIVYQQKTNPTKPRLRKGKPRRLSTLQPWHLVALSLLQASAWIIWWSKPCFSTFLEHMIGTWQSWHGKSCFCFPMFCCWKSNKKYIPPEKAFNIDDEFMIKNKHLGFSKMKRNLWFVYMI